MKRVPFILSIFFIAIVFMGVSSLHHPKVNVPSGINFLGVDEPARPPHVGPGAWKLLDFQGIENYVPVGDFYPGVHFSDVWIGLVDFDAGGNGNFANEPSPQTVAFIEDIDPLSYELIPGYIDFDEPVAGIGFFYCSISKMVIHEPLIVRLFDVEYVKIGEYTFSDTPINTGGDPTGAFTEFWSVDIILPKNCISRVEMIAAGSYWAMDDFRFVSIHDQEDEDESVDADTDEYIE